MIILETDRLIVKSSSLDRLEEVYILLSDPICMRYIGKGAKSREETIENLKVRIHHREKHGFSFDDVYEKQSGLYAGRAGLGYLEMNDQQPDIEIGYLLHQRFWGKGYATELAKAFIAWGFQHLPVTHLIAIIHPQNDRSRHVLEKCGMHSAGYIHCYNNDCEKYIIHK